MWLKKLIAWQLQWNAKMLNNDLMTCSIRSNIRFLWNLLSCSFPGCIMVCLWLVGNTSLQMSFTDNSSVPVKYTPHEQYKQSPINAFIKLRHQSSTVLECMPILRLTTDKSTWQTTICLIFSKTIQTKHVQCSAVLRHADWFSVAGATGYICRTTISLLHSLRQRRQAFEPVLPCQVAVQLINSCWSL